MHFGPKKVVLDLLLIFLIDIADAVLIFHLIILVFHQARNEFGLVLEFLSDFKGLGDKKFLFLLI